ncbi:U7-hexatoxin-Hi1a-like isoform 1-T2 [Leptodactylus fuscus]|uniref:U7-hexatoxin-Hi1a-like n=1 Tax=Leptodactylus fuscus TaxID=238119 RepID=UPI003F4ECAEE
MAGNVYMFLIIGSFLTLAVVGNRHLIGSYMDIDINREDVKQAADFALTEYNKESNDVKLLKCTDIKKAQSQVVAGTNMKLVMNCGKTSCRKNHVSEYGAGDACDVKSSEMSERCECTFIIFKSLPQSGEKRSLTYHECIPMQP